MVTRVDQRLAVTSSWVHGPGVALMSTICGSEPWLPSPPSVLDELLLDEMLDEVLDGVVLGDVAVDVGAGEMTVDVGSDPLSSLEPDEASAAPLAPSRDASAWLNHAGADSAAYQRGPPEWDAAAGAAVEPAAPSTATAAMVAPTEPATASCCTRDNAEMTDGPPERQDG
ncbi:hypothetical protein [Flexivirga lutea]